MRKSAYRSIVFIRCSQIDLRVESNLGIHSIINQIGGAELGASKELPDNLELNLRPQNSRIVDCSNEIWQP